MKVLLLHPAGSFPHSAHGWDLIVDLGRAPESTYQRWSQQADCPVVSIYDFAEEIEDLHRLRKLLHLGTGCMVDWWGIDWWDVLSLEIASELQQFMLVGRLARDLGAHCKLYSSRPHPLAAALQGLLHARLTILESGFHRALHRVRRYRNALSELDTVQFAQVIQDKLDPRHRIRRHLTIRSQGSGRPVTLLPTAYINGSRTALAYAARLPDHEFLLVCARSSCSSLTMPPNVGVRSLSPYFVSTDKTNLTPLLESWEGLRKQLVSSAEVFKIADAAGVLGRIPALLGWGIALHDAWNRIFDSENVVSCLCTDDSNPPTRIPLLLAKNRGIPALASHHGALDYAMAFKTHHADFYLAKSEMEHDYLRRVCHVAREKIVSAGQPLSPRPVVRRSEVRPADAAWLVFFTEPYPNAGWRSDEVYQDLLPRLVSLAQSCGLKLVFKLHPFESIKSHRRILRRHLGDRERQIQVIAGPPSNQLWQNIRFALTVQSSTAFECAALGIPVFLCAWLRDPYSGYVEQYARFGIGHALQSPQQIAETPQLLERQVGGRSLQDGLWRITKSERWAELFSVSHSLPVASNS
jgi:hypothetical protein